MTLRWLTDPQRKRIAIDFFGVDSNETASLERLQHGRGKRETSEKVVERAGATNRFEQLEHGALLRRARERFLAMNERRQILSQSHDSLRLPLRPRLLSASERCRKCSSEND